MIPIIWCVVNICMGITSVMLLWCCVCYCGAVYIIVVLCMLLWCCVCYCGAVYVIVVLCMLLWCCVCYRFLFDENTCALQYYVDSTANILHPLGYVLTVNL